MVTFEFENVDVEAARGAERLGKLKPPLGLLAKKSRLEEGAFFDSLKIPTAPWARGVGGSGCGGH
ncbi:hypothetical protein [Thermoproteus tenax]|uniref:Phosphoribosylaminoimidazole carboxylase n=1 Tax=Thermoproteus tenax (strain ATCC 35583 / DSM 2078 / JCM 9277 / NBRC 100435 / Kra 1) TaxID=768679 RepID=G4RJW4_THETK|nr:hypothetical protein [Thermoproteus tenax]CCC81859.1 phosphoribosylaminoimidazole carboxylase [Thermoproteus tenax Kra 1]